MSELKCPFCEAELLGTLCAKYCPNEDCMCYSETISTSVWQALISGKKAQDALKEIVNFFDTECEKDDLYFYNLIDDNIAKYREIISITKQEFNNENNV